MTNASDLPWALAACGFTAQFCADPVVHEVFRSWLERNGWKASADVFTPAVLEHSADLMVALVKDAEREMTMQELERLFAEGNYGETGLSFIYGRSMAGAGELLRPAL
jgi:hypothetical protein